MSIEFAPIKYEKKEIDIESLVLDIESYAKSIQENLSHFSSEEEFEESLDEEEKVKFSNAKANLLSMVAALTSTAVSIGYGKMAWVTSLGEDDRVKEALTSHYGIMSIIMAVMAIGNVVVVYAKKMEEEAESKPDVLDQV